MSFDYFYSNPSNTTQKKSDEPFFKKEGSVDHNRATTADFKNIHRSANKPFFSPPTIQPKLKIGSPNDQYEKEADAVADQVVGHSSHGNSPVAVQRKCAACEEEEKLQRKPAFESDEEGPDTVQTKLSKAPSLQFKCEECEQEEEKEQEETVPIQQKSDNHRTSIDTNIESQLSNSRGSGKPLPNNTRLSMEQTMGQDFSSVRVHTDSPAVQMNQQLSAQAFTHGSDIYFNQGKYDPDSSSGQHLLAHELVHTVQQGNSHSDIQRHPVGPTTARIEDKPTVLAMTLADFKRYTDRQADWFTHSSLSATDRENLWKLLLKAPRRGPVLAGVGDVLVSLLIPITGTQWMDLEIYCKGAHSGSHTVNITAGGSLARRIELGGTLKEIETIIDGRVLERSVRQTDLEKVHDDGLVTPLKLYWLIFEPFLQQAHNDPQGGKTEFERIIDLLKGPGIFPFITLLGRVRNLHRFSPKALRKLVTNYSNTSNNTNSPSSKPLYLVLHTGLDASGAFQASAHLFENLIQNKSKLVLMLEGQGSLAEITTQVPLLASAYGKPDASGTPRIAQVLIAGHGSSRSVALAGTPGSHDSMDLNNPAQRAKTERLLGALMDNMDPATARIVYAGCLVGTTQAPPINNASGTPSSAADITAHFGDPSNQSLVGFTQDMASRRGMARMPIEGARASVGLSASRSLQDSRGNLHVDYTYDPTAFGDAVAYIATGREPEGVMRAAVEVAATNSPIVAANQLRIRQGRPSTTNWFDPVTLAFVNEALNGVTVGAGVDIVRINKLAHMAEHFFTLYMGRTQVGHFGNVVNPHATLAEKMYTRIVAIPLINTPSDPDMQKGRFIMEQGWVLLKNTRAPQLIAYLDATAGLTTRLIRSYLDLLWMKHGSTSTVLFPAGASVSVGRTRLAIAWILKDQNPDDMATYRLRINPEVRNYLNARVITSGSRPRLNASIRSELSSPSDEDTILEILGRLTPTVPSGGAGGSSTSLDPANADVFPERSGPAMNDVRVETNPYIATVIAPAHVLNVRTQPSMRGRPFHWLRRGDDVHVMGFTHNWAAVDINGRLGFAYKKYLSPPP